MGFCIKNNTLSPKNCQKFGKFSLPLTIGGFNTA
jgi:hypothetical protein